MSPVLAARYRALALAGLRRPGAPAALPPRLLVVDVAGQRLGLLEDGLLAGDYPVSTAAAGVGGEDGSLRTPPGWHRIHACIGAGAAPGTVFVDRLPSGRVWGGEPGPEDLILTRVLTLDGLEPGVNRGPGRDSLARTIYIHGTNHPDRLGRPESHGCVRLSQADVIDLFGRVREGDPVLVAERPADPMGLGRLHFAGVGGSGMSALAQYVVLRGGRASGSDRSFDRGQNGPARALLERLGVAILPQDGGGVAGDCAAVVYSTAVEAQVPDFSEARARGVPLVHRSELLAHFVADRRTLAVTGTSGKSTTVAMAFEILRGAGRDPSVITGGELVALQGEGLWGNAWAGASDLLVVEADESDGSVVRYRPEVGVILNLQRDHKEMDEVAAMFTVFRAQARALVVGEAGNLAPFAAGATVFGFGPGARVRAEDLHEARTVQLQGGRHPVPAERARAPQRGERPGGHRRLPGAGGAPGGHGGAAGALPGRGPALPGAGRGGGRGGGGRLRAQSGQGRRLHPHRPPALRAGAGRVPAPRLRPHPLPAGRFRRSLRRRTRPQDRLWMLEIFYAGGTATRDLSSADLVADLVGRGVQARFAPDREALAAAIAAQARPGDLVLVMGARDPSLTTLARDILARIQ